MSLALVERLGHSLLINISQVGDFTRFVMRFFYWTGRRPYRIRMVIGQMYFIGNKSLLSFLSQGLLRVW